MKQPKPFQVMILAIAGALLLSVVLPLTHAPHQVAAQASAPTIELAYDDGSAFKTIRESVGGCPECHAYQGVRFDLPGGTEAVLTEVLFYAGERAGTLEVLVTDETCQSPLFDPIEVGVSTLGWYIVTVPETTVTGDFYVWVKKDGSAMPYHDVGTTVQRSYYSEHYNPTVVPHFLLDKGDLMIRALVRSTGGDSLPPNQPSNQLPAPGATNVSLTPTLQSSAFSDPDVGDTHAASQWQMRTISGDYTNPVLNSRSAPNSTSITVPPDTLAYSTTHYWRVRYMDNHGVWSEWSTETSFTTTAAPPNQPSNQLPAPGGTNVSLTPTLQSSAFSDPDVGDTHAASQWQITCNSGDYSSTVFDSGRDTFNKIQISIPSDHLEYSTTYYWRVRHQDNRGDWSDWSAETSFTTATPPDQPSNQLPAPGATNVSLTPTLQSSAFSDSDVGDNHTASQWQIRTRTDSHDTLVFDSGGDTANKTEIIIPSGYLDYSTTYYWQVRHQDSNGSWSEWSDETSFTTVAQDTVDGDGAPNGGNGEAGGCCAPADAKASVSDLAIVWGLLGLCCVTGLLVARSVSKRRSK